MKEELLGFYRLRELPGIRGERHVPSLKVAPIAGRACYIKTQSPRNSSAALRITNRRCISPKRGVILWVLQVDLVTDIQFDANPISAIQIGSRPSA